MEIVQGENVEFLCKVRGKPLPEVVWYKDIPLQKDEDVENVQRFEDEESFEIESKATIENIQISQEGKYKVKAINSAGIVKCELPVTGM